MKISKNAMSVLEKRYLIKDEHGIATETVEQLFMRVATAIASMDKSFNPKADINAVSDTFYNMMTNLEFLPNSPTLMNAGRPLGQLSACFVLPIGDSMEEIFEAIKQAALIHKSGGGTGFSFSRLRPSGSTVRTTGGVASGPISFMKVFNMATEAVKQGGTRRGANMGILRIDHPDILHFIDCKKDNNEINNFNISVGITEEFMEAVLADKSYNLIHPKTKAIAGSLDAKEVFTKIVEGAWRNGEPGIIFLDRLNRDNVVPAQGEIESTNPCGEQPLLPYESCNLGSINLVQMLKTTPNGVILDKDKLTKTVYNAVHFLDNVIEANKYPIEEIDRVTKLTRKIGLGVMGFSDMLLYMGLGYNTHEGVKMGEEIMSLVNDISHKATEDLARERGAFPLFAESTFKDMPPRRNATTTTIAPTGTLSIIGGCSSGVEPVFAYVYIRNIMDNTRMIEVNPVLKKVLIDRGLYTDELMNRIAKEGTLAHIEEIPEDIKRVFVCSHDISPEHHVKMQAAFQRHTDNAVSKTVNFTNNATMDDVRDVFILAYKEDCKGVTIYRDGSRDGQVLNIGEIKEVPKTEEVETEGIIEIKPRPRPEITQGITERMKIGCGNLYVTVNYDDKGICEVFTSTGKAGGCPSQSEATARLASIALRSGVSTAEVLNQLRGIRCPSTIRHSGMKCTSCPDAIARVVKKVADAIEQDKNPISLGKTAKNYKYCPDCGAKLQHEGGCTTCPDCGFSGCSVIQPNKPMDLDIDKYCPDCGEILEHEGGCNICRNCGYSKCK